ncbi:MAG: helix-hairpin-helix domain-containing protein [Candidatus Odinarchaeota archaeon]
MPPPKRKKGTSKKKKDISGLIEVLDVIDVIDDSNGSPPGNGIEERQQGKENQLDPAEKAGKELKKTAIKWVELFAGAGDTEKPELSRNKTHVLSVTVIRGIGVKTAEKLAENGIHNVEELLNSSDTVTLARILRVSQKKVRKWKLEAREILNHG